MAMLSLCGIGRLQLGLLYSGVLPNLCMLCAATMLNYCLLCAKQDTPPALHSAQLPLTFDECACLPELDAGWSMTATKNHCNVDKIACKLYAKLTHQPKHLQRRDGVSKHCACCLRQQCLYATKSKVSDHKSAQGSKAISIHYRACLIWSMYA